MRQFDVAVLFLAATILSGATASLTGNLRERTTANETLSARNCRSVDWTHVDSRTVLKSVATNKNADYVWALDPNTKVKYRQVIDRKPASGYWASIDGELDTISVSGNGKHIWGVDQSYNLFYRRVRNRDPTKDNETFKKFNRGQKFRSVSVNHCGSSVYGVDRDNNGELLFRDARQPNNPWKTFDAKLNNQIMSVVVSGNGQWVFVTDTRNRVYKSRTQNPCWSKISAGYAFHVISVDATGDNIWAIEDRSDYMFYMSDGGNWEDCNSKYKDVSVSGDAKNVWVIDQDGHTYHTADPPNMQTGDVEEIHCADPDSIPCKKES